MASSAATNFYQIATAYGDHTYPQGDHATTVQYISYFVSGDAVEAYPQMILMGDRNIGTRPLPHNTATPAVTNFAGSGIIGTDPLVARKMAGAGLATNDLHLKAGNVGY